MSWLGTWKYRRKISISDVNVDDVLSNFPIYLNISVSSGIGSADLTDIFDELTSDANRKKIAVTLSDGETQCYVEIERWDDANEKAVLWVKVPSVASGAITELYIYYDSAQSNNTTYVGDTEDIPAQSVWDANFKAVYHMAQDPNGDPANAIKDSTVNANHGTPGGSMTSADLVDGKIGKAIDFDGLNDFIGMGNVLDVTTGSITLEGIIKTSAGAAQVLFQKANDISITDPGYSFYIRTSNPYVRMAVCDGVDYAHQALSPTNVQDGAYHYVVGIWEVATHTVSSRVDSSLEGETVNANVDSLTNNNNFEIGRNYDAGSPSSHINGLLDEVRISNIVRSAAWIKATYYSNWDGLVSYGVAEEVGDSFVTITEVDVIFIGQIKNVAFKGIAAKVACVGFEHFLKQTVPKWRYQLTCNHMIFDTKCTKTAADYKVTTAITLDSTGTELTSADFGVQANGYFTGGKVVFGDETRTATDHTGNVITLMYKFRELEDNDSVDAYPGCDGRIETCKDKFDNLPNHLGFCHTPEENPALRVSW